MVDKIAIRISVVAAISGTKPGREEPAPELAGRAETGASAAEIRQTGARQS
jgi:hypothetical protein